VFGLLKGGLVNGRDPTSIVKDSVQLGMLFALIVNPSSTPVFVDAMRCQDSWRDGGDGFIEVAFSLHQSQVDIIAYMLTAYGIDWQLLVPMLARREMGRLGD
jgi:hypothetical protein